MHNKKFTFKSRVTIDLPRLILSGIIFLVLILIVIQVAK